MIQDGALIIVVDDDPLTCRMIEFLLGSQGYAVTALNEAPPALQQIEHKLPDLVLLDVQLPRMDGFTAMRHLKQQYPNLPVIMLTARAEMQDRLSGLEAGADDYIVKPFEPAELLARVKAVLRRAKRNISTAADGVIAENGIRLDVHNLAATIPGGDIIPLTPTETRILHRLMANPNHVISREDLTAFAVGYGADTSNNQIDVYVGRIRRKIKDDLNNPQYIVTVRGSGYKFLSPARLTSRPMGSPSQ